MKNLLLMRHAKSSWKNATIADHDRPLKSRGIADASKMGKLMAELELIPDVILCSSAMRARQTTDYFLSECPFDGNAFYSRNLYHGGPEDFIAELKKLDDSNKIVLIVSHNPGVEDVLEDICGVDEFMPTAAIALIRIDIEKWRDMNLDTIGSFMSIWRPKEI